MVERLLLTELVVTPTGGEFIEIFNPTDEAVDLSDYYVTDATFASGGAFYYNIVTGSNAGGGGFSDFHARFPDGASIDPGSYQTIAIAGSDSFEAAYSQSPTYELFEDGTSADGIADMREALPGSINDQGGLTNSGEVVILYNWDGASDLVTDVDYALWGDKAEAVDKTGVSIDGPDAGTDETGYNADTAIADQDVIASGAHPSGQSFQRSDFSEGAETQSSGNGVDGADETSEDLSNTWEIADATPNAALEDDDDGGNGGEPVTATIMEIQGSEATSPLEGQRVATTGVVTALDDNGFYMQDPAGDGDTSTSDGIFVFTDSAPTVALNDAVTVEGDVVEFLPGGDPDNLTITQITDPNVTVTGFGVVATTIIGGDVGDRTPPSDSILEGIDFYESLEGMFVGVNDGIAIDPDNRFGEVWLVSQGASEPVTDNGGIKAADGDLNPERMQIDDGLPSGSTPDTVTGDFLDPFTGVVSYSFGNYEILVDGDVGVTPINNAFETTEIAGDEDTLTLASYNVLNLDPGDTDQLALLGQQITDNLGSPDIIGLQEIQDNNGSTNNGVVDADQTFAALIQAIEDAGGPTYEFAQINPEDGQDGGQPGGNIRVGFLFNPDRVSLPTDSIGDATTATQIIDNGGEAELSFGVGRIDPNNPAFDGSRKPLVAAFEFNGETVFAVVNHFSSKSGSDPLFGSIQPPNEAASDAREAQGQVVNDFVDDILAIEPDAKVVVLGDHNDFEFSQPLANLTGDALTNLADNVPEGDLYSFIFEGNSQAIDHVLVSDSLLPSADVDYVHVNADFEFDESGSDHDAVVASVDIETSEPTFVISEIDSDTVGQDRAEFIELFDGGVGNASLDGLVLVGINGSRELVDFAIDLDGFSTGENGLFVVGSDDVPNVDLVAFDVNDLQNGSDAVALYEGDATDFPENAALTLDDLIDAVVYETDDSDDPGLAPLLLNGGQINEDENNQKDTESVQRIVGNDSVRDTEAFFVAEATPGELNEIVMTAAVV